MIKKLGSIEVKNVKIKKRHRRLPPHTLLPDEKLEEFISKISDENERYSVSSLAKAHPSFRRCVKDGRLIRMPSSFERRLVAKFGVRIRYKQAFDIEADEYLIRFHTEKVSDDKQKHPKNPTALPNEH